MHQAFMHFAKLGLSKTCLIVCEESSSNAPIPLHKRFLFYCSTLIANFIVVNSFNEAKLIKKPLAENSKQKLFGMVLILTKFSIKKIIEMI